MRPLRTLSSTNQLAPRPNGFEEQLPRPITSFIGREVAAGELLALITDPGLQLVTLTGPGGIGKTRLAIQVARQAADQFRDGVVFVRLADVREPALVPATIAHALGIHEAIGNVLLERIRDACHDAYLLLVVDNLEHLLDAAEFLSAIVALCPGITVLATSRHRLQLSGERVFELGPLAMDHAVTLFGQRAQAIAPGFRLTDESRMEIADVCGHLDGLPLAIELAAARVPVLSPQAMRMRIGNRMELLGEGMRDAPARHGGIREAIAWSYDLLAESEQELYRRLSVFEGGFTIDAAAAVGTNVDDVLPGLSALEAGSLLKLRSDQHGGDRFFMLETIREFALERLREHGEESNARQAHAAYFARLADNTERIWWESGGSDRLDDLEPEIPNIRAALAWLKEAGNFGDLLGLGGSLNPLWASRGYSLEGQALLEWGLERADNVATDVVILALRGLSWILNRHGDFYRALLTAQQALTLARECQDGRSVALSAILCGIAARGCGLQEQAVAFQELTLAILDSRQGESWTLVARCIVLNQLGVIAIDQGDIDQAERWYTQSISLQQESGLRFTHSSHATRGLGEVARARGDLEQALHYFQNALHYAHGVQDVRAIANLLGEIAGVLAARGQHERAARLFGASKAYHERIVLPFESWTFDRERAMGLPEPWARAGQDHGAAEPLYRAIEARTAAIRAVALDPDLARSWWLEGRTLTLDDAMTLAQGAELDAQGTSKRPDGLSQREVEVLRLLAQGHTDREIAALLHVSPRTVQNHVQHIYGKIEVSSRSAATKWSLVRGIA